MRQRLTLPRALELGRWPAGRADLGAWLPWQGAAKPGAARRDGGGCLGRAGARVVGVSSGGHHCGWARRGLLHQAAPQQGGAPYTEVRFCLHPKCLETLRTL